MYKRIVVTGSLAYDHIMSMPGKFSDHIMPDKLHILNVSFIMQTFRREFGGTGGNIAYSLASLEIPTALVGSSGNDFSEYALHLKRLRYLDISGVQVVKNTPTAQGFVTTDRDDNQIWGFYEGAMKYSSRISLKDILRPDDFLVIAPNDPVATINYAKEATKLNIPYMFDPAFNIPHFTKSDLESSVNNATIVIGNDYEIELIKRKLSLKSLPRTQKIWITTLGSKGSTINQDSNEWKIPPAKPKNTSDPTGAGDAYRAGFLAGYVKALPLDRCGKMGSLSAAYTVEAYGTQTHKFTVGEFQKRFDKNF